MFQIRSLRLVVLNRYEALAFLTLAEVVLETMKDLIKKKDTEIADLKEALDRNRTNYAAIKSSEVNLTRQNRELREELNKYKTPKQNGQK